MKKVGRIVDIVITVLNLICFLIFALEGIIKHDAYYVSVACMNLILGLYFTNKLTTNK